MKKLDFILFSDTLPNRKILPRFSASEEILEYRSFSALVGEQPKMSTESYKKLIGSQMLPECGS